MTTEKQLRQAKMLKHSLELSIKFFAKQKRQSKDLKTALTKAKRVITKLEKKIQA